MNEEISKQEIKRQLQIQNWSNKDILENIEKRNFDIAIYGDQINKKEFVKTTEILKEILLDKLSKNNIEEFKKKLLEEINKIWVTSLEGVNNISIKDQQKEFLDKKDIIEVINNFGLSDQEIIAERQLDEDINIKEKI